MMTNLFSIFDPMTSSKFSLNWMSMIMPLFLIQWPYWLIPSRFNIFWNIITLTLYNEFKFLTKIKCNIIIFVSLFMLILLINFTSLFPYIFTSTSHLSFTLSLSLPLWLSMMLYGWYNDMNYMFTHMVPQGTPSPLLMFMVIIETISNIIRPGTLAIRLTANMIAGHLLLTLMGNTGPNLPFLILMIMLILQSILMILEMAVAIIQSYVFSILMTLYSNDVN